MQNGDTRWGSGCEHATQPKQHASGTALRPEAEGPVKKHKKPILAAMRAVGSGRRGRSGPTVPSEAVDAGRVKGADSFSHAGAHWQPETKGVEEGGRGMGGGMEQSHSNEPWQWDDVFRSARWQIARNNKYKQSQGLGGNESRCARRAQQTESSKTCDITSMYGGSAEPSTMEIG